MLGDLFNDTMNVCVSVRARAFMQYQELHLQHSSKKCSTTEPQPRHLNAAFHFRKYWLAFTENPILP